MSRRPPKRPAWWNRRSWFSIRRSRRRAWLSWYETDDAPEPVRYGKQWMAGF